MAVRVSAQGDRNSVRLKWDSEVGSPPRRLWEPGCADLPELSFPQKDNGIYSVQLTDFMSAGSRAGMR